MHEKQIEPSEREKSNLSQRERSTVSVNNEHAGEKTLDAIQMNGVPNGKPKLADEESGSSLTMSSDDLNALHEGE